MSAVVSRLDSIIDTAILRREVVRRRRLLGATAVLFVVSTSPVIGHHLVRAADWLPASLQHWGPLCMVSLHLLLVPLHAAFHWLLAGGVLFAMTERLRALLRLRRAMRRVEFVSPGVGDRIYHAACLAGVEPRNLRTAASLAVPAFTAGLWSPRIYLSSALATVLSPEELASVIAHEEAHRRRRDPLRLSALRFLSSLLFWMPALRRIADDLADEAEIDADTAAAARYPVALASAMVVMARLPAQSGDVGNAVRFQSVDLLERRMERLAGIPPKVSSRVSRRSLALAGVALVAAWTSGVMVLHPLAAPGTHHAGSTHCATHAALPLSHLFCRGWGWTWHDRACPHAS